MAASTFFQVEVDFGKGWQRNYQEHEDFNMALGMARWFVKLGQVRIVQVKKVLEVEESVFFELESVPDFLPNNRRLRDILEQSKRTWKPQHIETLMLEECCELGVELSRGIGRPSRKDRAKIQEELADVIITAWELAQHYDDDEGVSKWIKRKLEREKERMNDPNYGKDEKDK